MYQQNIPHPAEVAQSIMPPDLGLVDQIACKARYAASIFATSMAQKIQHPIRQAFWATAASNAFNNGIIRDLLTTSLVYTAMSCRTPQDKYDHMLEQVVPMITTIHMWWFTSQRPDLQQYVAQDQALLQEYRTRIMEYQQVQTAVNAVLPQFRRQDGQVAQTPVQNYQNQAMAGMGGMYQAPMAGPATIPPPDIFNNNQTANASSTHAGLDVGAELASIPTIGDETYEMMAEYPSASMGEMVLPMFDDNNQNTSTFKPEQGKSTINIPYREKRGFRASNQKRPYPMAYNYTTHRVEFDPNNYEVIVEEPEMDILNHAARQLLVRQLPEKLGGEIIDPTNPDSVPAPIVADLVDVETSMPFTEIKHATSDESEEYIDNLIGLVCLEDAVPTSYLNARPFYFKDSRKRIEYMESVIKAACGHRNVKAFVEDMLRERASFSTYMWNTISKMASREFEECLLYNLGVDYYRGIDFFKDAKDVMDMLLEDFGEFWVGQMDERFLPRLAKLLEFNYEEGFTKANPDDFISVALSVEDRLVTIPMYSTDLAIDIVEGYGKVDGAYFPHFYDFCLRLEKDGVGLSRSRNWLSFRDGTKIRIEKGWLGGSTFIVSDGTAVK